MEIHNRAEEAVIAFVNDIFDTEEREKELGYCTCYQCRLDVSCYALNRVAPEYVISQRGMAHGEQDYLERLQKQADLVSLIKEGMERIDQTKRPHFSHGGKGRSPVYPEPPVFNYPTLMGRLFNGANFEPLSGMSVSLQRSGGGLVEMIDPNWENPCTLVSNTAGTFLFWPMPEKAPAADAEKEAEFEVVASAPGFEELRHFVTVKLRAEDKVQDSLSAQRAFPMKDLYLFPK